MFICIYIPLISAYDVLFVKTQFEYEQNWAL